MERLIITTVLLMTLLHTSLNDCVIETQRTTDSYLCKTIATYSYRYDNCRNVIYPIQRVITCRNIVWEEGKPSFSADNNIIKGDYRYNRYTRKEISMDNETNLRVTDSYITMLPVSAFQNISKVKKIYLNNLDIQKIVPGAFNFQTDIQEIYLDNNNLTIISDGIFNSLTKLKVLNLSFNFIEIVTEQAFHGTQLSFLYLSNNNLKTFFSTLTLASWETLTYLDISFNKITELTIGLHNTSKLGTILLNKNNIQFVKFEQFNKALKKIDLSSNKIDSISNFSLLKASEIRLKHNQINKLEKNDYVEILEISYNLLQELSSAMLGTKLKSLDVIQNFITSLPGDTFSDLPKLEHLHLAGNKLVVLPNSAFKNNKLLKFLDLSLNQLTEFPYGAFDNLGRLRNLNISFNEFETMPLNVLHSLANLQQFYIQDNKIQNMDTDDFLKYVPKLDDINLDNNPWSCKNLLNIVHVLKQHKVNIVQGSITDSHNIYGIKCANANENENEEFRSSETIVKELLGKINDQHLSEDMYKIEIFILIFLVAVVSLLLVIAIFIFNVYKRLRNLGVSETEMSQLLQSKY